MSNSIPLPTVVLQWISPLVVYRYKTRGKELVLDEVTPPSLIFFSPLTPRIPSMVSTAFFFFSCFSLSLAVSLDEFVGGHKNGQTTVSKHFFKISEDGKEFSQRIRRGEGKADPVSFTLKTECSFKNGTRRISVLWKAEGGIRPSLFRPSCRRCPC